MLLCLRFSGMVSGDWTMDWSGQCTAVVSDNILKYTDVVHELE